MKKRRQQMHLDRVIMKEDHARAEGVTYESGEF